MNPHFSPLVLLSGIFALFAIAGLNAWTSRINQFFFFARTLPLAFRETSVARRITRRYLGMICISAGLSTLFFTCFYAIKALPLSIALVGALLVEVIGVTVSFAIAHRLAGSAFAAFQETAGTGPSSETMSVLDRAVSVPLLSGERTTTVRAMLAPPLAAVSLWLAGIATSNYSLSRFASAAGEQGGAVLLGMACGMLFAGTAMRLMLRYSARPRTPMAGYITRVMAVLSWFSVGVIGGIVVATRMHSTITRNTAHEVMLIIVALIAVSIVSMWGRNNQFVPAQAEQNGDQYWLAGLFYHNRQDPALFVQRRSGPGYTLNFGNLFSWPLAAFFVADFAFIFFARHHI